MGFTIEQLEEDHADLKHIVGEFEIGLKALRGPNYLTGIEKDERLPVKLLYDGYLKAKTELETFEAKTYIEDIPAEESNA